MATPPVPPADPNTIAAVVEIGHKVRDAADAVIAHLHLKYIVGIFAALCLICYGAAKAYGWYEGRLSRDQSARAVLEQHLSATEKATDVWREQALALSRTRSVDTVRTVTFITNVRTVTVPFPVMQPNGTMTEIPMPVVLRADFDSLGRFCARERHDCTQLVAAKDSVIESMGTQVHDLTQITKNVDDQIAAINHANFWTKITWGTGGAAAGFSAGFAAGALTCHR